jgi:regulator of protease activity HflC (stomatin/prohibitin superfamily)
MSVVLDAIIAFIVFIVAVILLSGIKVVNEWERLPVLILGRFAGLKGPGIVYVPPIIGRVPMRISTRLQAIAFRTEQSLTKDNVPVIVDAVMYYQPVDLEKVVLKVEDYNVATRLAAGPRSGHVEAGPGREGEEGEGNPSSGRVRGGPEDGRGRQPLRK